MLFSQTMKNTRNLTLTKALLGSFLLLSLILPGAGMETARAAEASRVGILPFAVNASDKLDYLKEGLQDMLASRLAWELGSGLTAFRFRWLRKNFPADEKKKTLLIGREFVCGLLLLQERHRHQDRHQPDSKPGRLSRPAALKFSQAKGWTRSLSRSMSCPMTSMKIFDPGLCGGGLPRSPSRPERRPLRRCFRKSSGLEGLYHQCPFPQIILNTEVLM
jgi:hypothetical protein